MPSFTFPATAQAALWRGLEPRLIDIDAGHWHMDASLLARVIRDGRNDLRVVLAVSAFGTPPPAETRIHWEQLCRAAGIPLVVDSAAGFGAVADDGTPIGAQGDLEVVSFHATKPFAVGEGGAVFTRARRLHERVELAANFGLRSDRSLGLAMGLNAKMSEVHAATALAVLDELDVILEQRRRAADQVRAQAGSNVAWQVGCERSTWQFVPVAFLDPDRRAQAVASCDAGVEVRTYYEPLHKMAAFEHWPVVDRGLPMTRDLHERLLCLPMANDMDDRELDLIAGVARSGLPTAIQSSPSATG
jgi:dTDP-4-amino-4,6-dideoxygalactose transaminase